MSEKGQDKNFIEFDNVRCQNNKNLKNGGLSAEVEKDGPYCVIRTGHMLLPFKFFIT